MASPLEFVGKELKENVRVVSDSIGKLEQPLVEMAAAGIDSIRNGGKILFCGNGGSAADAQHLSTELVSKLTFVRPPIASLALTVNTSLITAHSNDFGFDEVFSRQIRALGKNGDMLVAISTSGKSQNILNAVRTASEIGIKTAAFLGKDGGEILGLADHVLVVPSNNTQRIQEVHILLGHIFCEILEKTLFEKES